MSTKPSLFLKDALIAYNPGTNQIRVGTLMHDYEADWTESPIRYRYTSGAAYADVRKMDGQAAKIYVLNLFNTMVIRDKVDPIAAHAALCVIREFAESINMECPGAVETAQVS